MTKKDPSQYRTFADYLEATTNPVLAESIREEEFIETVTCSVCGGKVKHKKKMLECTNCGATTRLVG